ncbi:MAG: ACT domain protein [Thiothrix sp.]|nr:ACT domain protein [Thiothrix sp.]HPE60888.1 ACT domain-containing protein [Thiolinea sp.]
MQTSIILTLLGNDRAGLVRALSRILEQQQGNWTESRMVRMANKFAGVLQATLPTERLDAFMTGLDALRGEGLQITVEQESVTAPGLSESLALELLGPDHPGIIHQIADRLAALKVNIEELTSEQRPAPMSGESLFYASLKLGLPAGVSAESVQDALEGLQDSLMVDLSFHG